LNRASNRLRTELSYTRLSDQVKAIAGLLEEKASNLIANQEIALILDLQTDEWWQDVTTPTLENVRNRPRRLVRRAKAGGLRGIGRCRIPPRCRALAPLPLALAQPQPGAGYCQ
jgi:type I site-specific restriction endonuclease